MNKNDGGPAFPSEGFVCSDGIKYDGMTLRDYFAAKAMQGIIQRDDYEYARHVAEVVYKIADAMLAEREKNETI